MRKYIIAISAAAALCCLTACSNQNENADTTAAAAESATVSENLSAEGTSPEEDASETVQTSGSNILIVYFSVPETSGVDANSGAS